MVQYETSNEIWSEWSEFSTCSLQCEYDGNVGQKTRTRTCNDFDGNPSQKCPGVGSESRKSSYHKY